MSYIVRTDVEKFFAERARGANRAEALRILKRAGRGNPPVPGDELPPGWKNVAKKAAQNGRSGI